MCSSLIVKIGADKEAVVLLSRVLSGITKEII
jgi:hypothetical protein